MTTTKFLGIWMDHSSAHLTELTAAPLNSTTITSKFTHDAKVNSLTHSEHMMHTKEQHQQAEYYKELGEAIISYKDVLLFGPTDAKTELFNILKADHRFKDIRIEVKPTDKMTDNQQHAFVKEHFSKH